jgi:hypothetical protein
MAQQRSLFSFFNKDSAIASDHTSTSSPVQSRNDNKGEKLSSKHNRPQQQQQEQSGSGVKKGVSTVSESDETARLQIQWPPPGFVNSEQQFSLSYSSSPATELVVSVGSEEICALLLANLSTFIAEGFPSKMLCLADC